MNPFAVILLGADCLVVVLLLVWGVRRVRRPLARLGRFLGRAWTGQVFLGSAARRQRRDLRRWERQCRDLRAVELLFVDAPDSEEAQR